MKRALLLLALCCGFSMANAQISTGENSTRVIRTGNRAQAGNFGLYLGATTDMFKKIGDSDVDFSALPLINLKYMCTDNTEFRLGIEWWKSKQKTTDNSGSNDYEYYNSEKSYMLYPGIAYHFNNRNLLDVYVGGELPLGFGNQGGGNQDDEFYTSHFTFGLGGFIGLQAYVANLPLAVGVEYGISTRYNSVSDGRFTADGQVINDKQLHAGSLENFEYREDYGAQTFKLGHQARFTLTYYFNL